MTELERITKALESIAESLEKIANPLIGVKLGESACDQINDGPVKWIASRDPFAMMDSE